MLIIAGADYVGKTTLAQACVKRLNDMGYPHMYQHLTRPPECFDYFMGYLEKASKHSVWDRFHIDNLAYRACDKHPTQMTPTGYRLIDAHLKLMCSFVVVLVGTENVIKQRAEKRGADEMYDLKHILQVNDEFCALGRHEPYIMRDQLYEPTIDLVVDVSNNHDHSETVVAMYREHFDACMSYLG